MERVKRLQNTNAGSSCRTIYNQEIEHFKNGVDLNQTSTKIAESSVSGLHEVHRIGFTSDNNEYITDLVLNLAIECEVIKPSTTKNDSSGKYENLPKSFLGQVIPEIEITNGKYTTGGKKTYTVMVTKPDITDAVHVNNIEFEKNVVKKKLNFEELPLYKQLFALNKIKSDYKAAETLGMSRVINEFWSTNTINELYLPKKQLTFFFQDGRNREYFAANFDSFLEDCMHQSDLSKIDGLVNGHGDNFTPLSTTDAKNKLTTNEIKKSILLLKGLINSLSKQFTTLERCGFVDMFLKLGEGYAYKKPTDSNNTNKDLTRLNPYNAIFTQCKKVASANTKHIDWVKTAFEVLYGGPLPLGFYATTQFENIAKKLALIINADGVPMGNMLAAFGAPITNDANYNASKDVLFEFEDEFKALNDVEYVDFDETHDKFASPDNDVADISNLIGKAMVSYGGGITYDLTGHELRTLFGDDFIKIHRHVLVSDTKKMIFCRARIGVTSDFREFPDDPVYFDPGVFDLALTFKHDAISTDHVRPVDVSSWVSYKCYKSTTDRHAHRLGDILDGSVSLYRVPIPSTYSVNTTPYTAPTSLLLPIAKLGEAFLYSVSLGRNGYSTSTNIDQVGSYNIRFGETSDELSADLLSDLSEKPMKSHDNKSLTTVVRETGVLFGGTYSKYHQQLNINFSETKNSRKLTSEKKVTISIIPVVEFLKQTKVSSVPPGRSFSVVSANEKFEVY